MPSAWQFESRAYFYFDILKIFLTWLCFSDFFSSTKLFWRLFYIWVTLRFWASFWWLDSDNRQSSWPWFFRFLCHGSHRVLPCEQRPFVSIFQRDSARRVAISLLACLEVDNHLSCWLCGVRELLVTYSLGQNKMEQQTPISPKSRMKQRKSQNAPFSHPWFGGGEGGYKFLIYFVQDCSLWVFFSTRPKRFGSHGMFALDTPGPEAWNLFQTLLKAVSLSTCFLPCCPRVVLFSFAEFFLAKDFAWVQSKYQLNSLSSQR